MWKGMKCIISDSATDTLCVTARHEAVQIIRFILWIASSFLLAMTRSDDKPNNYKLLTTNYKLRNNG